MPNGIASIGSTSGKDSTAASSRCQPSRALAAFLACSALFAAALSGESLRGVAEKPARFTAPKNAAVPFDSWPVLTTVAV